jgi:chorismate mutase/prephenate dehydratase
MTGPEQPSGASLETLRAEIDKIDAEIHDRLMARASIVQALGDWKRQNGQAAGAYFHPGREARILRTLAARHGGPLPVTAVLALWRTLVSAYLRLQWPFQVVVADDAATRDLARQHFGAATPVATAADPLAALAANEETLAVMPDVADGSGWWCAAPFLSRTGPRIVARLPFFGEGNGPAAYVVARHGADASGDDVTLAVVAGGKAPQAPGLELSLLATYKAPGGGTCHLVALDGHLSEDAAVLQALRASGEVHIVGGYARPLTLPRA